MDIKQFVGRISNADPHDIPPGGFVELDNLTCIVPGQLTGRNGCRELLIDNRREYSEDPPVAPYDNVQGLASYFLQRGEANWILWQRSDGSIHAGKHPHVPPAPEPEE
jgi:hypothetical protein